MGDSFSDPFSLVSLAKGDNIEAGFFSGAAGSLAGGIEDYGLDVVAGAVTGGTASVIAGGKFINGAVTGATAALAARGANAYKDRRAELKKASMPTGAAGYGPEQNKIKIFIKDRWETMSGVADKLESLATSIGDLVSLKEFSERWESAMNFRKHAKDKMVYGKGSEEQQLWRDILRSSGNSTGRIIYNGATDVEDSVVGEYTSTRFTGTLLKIILPYEAPLGPYSGYTVIHGGNSFEL